MKCRVAAVSLLVVLISLAVPAQAQTLAAIKTGAGNAVAVCATPGRLMAFLSDRNPNLDPRFATVAVEYMRLGEQLGVRWDLAFFQMLLETGNLSFRRGDGRPGDVLPTQYNFAGLGATGRGERGERFPDVATGVKAHLQHLLLYAGDTVDNPVAERTRKVQEWGILTSWRKGIRGPVTFADLGRKWAPTDRAYAAKIAAIAKSFQDDVCGRPDPRPELVAEARGARGDVLAKTATADETKPSGSELARRALDQARAEGATRSSLGAGAIARRTAETAASAQPQVPATTGGEPKAELGSGEKMAAAAPGAASATRPAPGQCRVWTASYGGQKSVIIKAAGDGFINYTVLDVNEGSEKRETEAYIAAYAKGGATVGEFTSQTTALDRAFELCPEG